MSAHISAAEALLSMLEASKKVSIGMRDGATKVLRGLEQRQREFEEKKKRIEDDIKRGSRVTKHRLPL